MENDKKRVVMKERVVMTPPYTADTSRPCPHGRGTVFTCGWLMNGSDTDFPYCINSAAERCPQIESGMKKDLALQSTKLNSG